MADAGRRSHDVLHWLMERRRGRVGPARAPRRQEAFPAVVEVQALHPVRRILGHHRAVYQVVFAPNGRWFVTVAGRGGVKIWNATTLCLIGVVKLGKGNYVGTVAVEPEGRAIAWTGVDSVGLVRVTAAGSPVPGSLRVLLKWNSALERAKYPQRPHIAWSAALQLSVATGARLVVIYVLLPEDAQGKAFHKVFAVHDVAVPRQCAWCKLNAATSYLAVTTSSGVQVLEFPNTVACFEHRVAPQGPSARQSSIAHLSANRLTLFELVLGKTQMARAVKFATHSVATLLIFVAPRTSKRSVITGIPLLLHITPPCRGMDGRVEGVSGVCDTAPRARPPRRIHSDPDVFASITDGRPLPYELLSHNHLRLLCKLRQLECSEHDSPLPADVLVAKLKKFDESVAPANGDDGSSDYENMRDPQLYVLCNARGLSTTSAMTRNAMVYFLREERRSRKRRAEASSGDSESHVTSSHDVSDNGDNSGSEGSSDYSAMSKGALEDLCSSRQISLRSSERGSARRRSDRESDSDSSDSSDEPRPYEKMKWAELRDLCRSRGLTPGRYSIVKMAEALREEDEAVAANAEMSDADAEVCRSYSRMSLDELKALGKQRGFDWFEGMHGKGGTRQLMVHVLQQADADNAGEGSATEADADTGADTDVDAHEDAGSEGAPDAVPTLVIAKRRYSRMTVDELQALGRDRGFDWFQVRSDTRELMQTFLANADIEARKKAMEAERLVGGGIEREDTLLVTAQPSGSASSSARSQGDLAGFTISELKERCVLQGLVPAARARKQDLIDLLEDHSDAPQTRVTHESASASAPAPLNAGPRLAFRSTPRWKFKRLKRPAQTVLEDALAVHRNHGQHRKGRHPRLDHKPIGNTNATVLVDLAPSGLLHILYKKGSSCAYGAWNAAGCIASQKLLYNDRDDAPVSIVAHPRQAGIVCVKQPTQELQYWDVGGGQARHVHTTLHLSSDPIARDAQVLGASPTFANNGALLVIPDNIGLLSIFAAHADAALQAAPVQQFFDEEYETHPQPAVLLPWVPGADPQRSVIRQAVGNYLDLDPVDNPSVPLTRVEEEDALVYHLSAEQSDEDSLASAFLSSTDSDDSRSGSARSQPQSHPQPPAPQAPSAPHPSQYFYDPQLDNDADASASHGSVDGYHVSLLGDSDSTRADSSSSSSSSSSVDDSAEDGEGESSESAPGRAARKKKNGERGQYGSKTAVINYRRIRERQLRKLCQLRCIFDQRETRTVEEMARQLEYDDEYDRQEAHEDHSSTPLDGLRHLCTMRGLPSQGTRDVVVARLNQAFDTRWRRRVQLRLLGKDVSLHALTQLCASRGVHSTGSQKQVAALVATLTDPADGNKVVRTALGKDRRNDSSSSDIDDGDASSSSAPSMQIGADYKAMRHESLVTLCLRRKLRYGGKRAALIERLSTFDGEYGSAVGKKGQERKGVEDTEVEEDGRSSSTGPPRKRRKTRGTVLEYSQLKHVELKTLCRKRGLPLRGSKQDLAAQLEDADARGGSPSDSESRTDDGILETRTFAQLRGLCRKRGLSSRGDRAALIALLKKAKESDGDKHDRYDGDDSDEDDALRAQYERLCKRRLEELCHARGLDMGTRRVMIGHLVREDKKSAGQDGDSETEDDIGSGISSAGDAATVSYRTLPLRQLQALCVQRRLDKRGTHEGLIKRLRIWDRRHETVTAANRNQRGTHTRYHDMSSTDLRRACAQRGLRSRASKEQRIAVLQEDDVWRVHRAAVVVLLAGAVVGWRVFQPKDLLELRDLCRKRRLPTQGTAEELSERLRDPPQPRAMPPVPRPAVSPTAAPNGEVPVNFKQMTLLQLQKECQDRGMVDCGLRHQLIRRLENDECGEGDAALAGGRKRAASESSADSALPPVIPGGVPPKKRVKLCDISETFPSADSESPVAAAPAPSQHEMGYRRHDSDVFPTSLFGSYDIPGGGARPPAWGFGRLDSYSTYALESMARLHGVHHSGSRRSILFALRRAGIS